MRQVACDRPQMVLSQIGHVAAGSDQIQADGARDRSAGEIGHRVDQDGLFLREERGQPVGVDRLGAGSHGRREVRRLLHDQIVGGHAEIGVLVGMVTQPGQAQPLHHARELPGKYRACLPACLELAVRRPGLRPDRTAIQFMPSDHYNTISDADLGAMIGYLTQLRPTGNERSRVELNPVARLLIGVGLFGEVNRTAKIDFARSRSEPFSDDGAYLTGIAGCTFCHGSQLEGGQGPEPGAPAAPCLIGLDPLCAMAKADFVRSLRLGIARDGHTIQPKYMPWLGYRNMTDLELTSIWQYMRRQD